MASKKRKLEVELLVLMARASAIEKRETGMISTDSVGGEPSVQVAWDALAEAAISDVWTWKRLDPGVRKPWEASVTIAGVVFFALFTDDEQQAVIDGS